MEILCETEKRLKEGGVNLEDLHVEPAPGQFEFNYQPAWGILGIINIFLSVPSFQTKILKALGFLK